MKTKIFFAVLICFLFILSFQLNFSIHGEQQFSYLAQSFSHGKTYFLEMPGSWNDAAFFNGKYYWAEGPFPAVLLAPFIIIFGFFKLFFHQGYLNMVLVIVNFFLVYKIAKKIGYSSSDGLWLSSALIFGSSYICLAFIPWVWYFSQSVTVLLLLLVIYEFVNQRRAWFFGLLFSLIIATRFSVFPAIFTFGYFVSKTGKIKSFLIPIAISLILLGFYNYVRFSNIFEFGYKYTLLPTDTTLSREFGIFSFQHFPKNIYYSLINIYPNQMGTSLFLVSPYLFYLFLNKKYDFVSKILLLTCTVIFLLLLTYHGTGFRQFGYRFSMDFFPILFFVLIRNYHRIHGRLSPIFKTVIFLTIFSDVYLFLKFFF